MNYQPRLMQRVRPGMAVQVPTYLLDLVSDVRCDPRQARGLIYRAFCRAANRGYPAPSGEVLAIICGYESGHGTVNPVKRLERNKMIRVSRHQRSRRIYIVATGKWTAPCSDDRPHWRERLDSTGAGQQVGAAA